MKRILAQSIIERSAETKMLFALQAILAFQAVRHYVVCYRFATARDVDALSQRPRLVHQRNAVIVERSR